MPGSSAVARQVVANPFLTLSTAAAIGSYVCILLVWVAERFIALPSLHLYVQVMTVICCLSMVGHVAAMLTMMRANDEFWRALIGKRIAIAAFATFGILTIWGLLLNLGWAPPFTLMFAYALFLLVHTLIIPFVNAARP